MSNAFSKSKKNAIALRAFSRHSDSSQVIEQTASEWHELRICILITLQSLHDIINYTIINYIYTYISIHQPIKAEMYRRL